MFVFKLRKDFHSIHILRENKKLFDISKIKFFINEFYKDEKYFDDIALLTIRKFYAYSKLPKYNSHKFLPEKISLAYIYFNKSRRTHYIENLFDELFEITKCESEKYLQDAIPFEPYIKIHYEPETKDIKFELFISE